MPSNFVQKIRDVFSWQSDSYHVQKENQLVGRPMLASGGPAVDPPIFNLPIDPNNNNNNGAGPIPSIQNINGERMSVFYTDKKPPKRTKVSWWCTRSR